MFAQRDGAFPLQGQGKGLDERVRKLTLAPKGVGMKMDHGEWLLAEGKCEGKPMFVRCAFTITTNGERHFTVHTADVAGFMERLQNLPHPHGRYPISLECDEDPEWNYYGSSQSRPTR